MVNSPPLHQRNSTAFPWLSNIILGYDVFGVLLQCYQCGKLLPSFVESVKMVVLFPGILIIYKIYSNFTLALKFFLFFFSTSNLSKYISTIC